MRAEVEAERQELLEQVARLSQEADMLDEALRHYAQIVGASTIAPEEPNTIPHSRSDSTTANSIRDEMLAVMREAGVPLHYRVEMLPLLLQRGVQFTGKNPAGALSAHLSEDARFVKAEGRPGYWTLASWVVDRGNNPKSPDTPEQSPIESSAREERADEPAESDKPPPGGQQPPLVSREGEHSPWAPIPNAHLLKRHHHESGMMA